MSSKDEFLQYLGAAGGTIALAFLAQAGLRSCIDVGYHDKLATRGPSEQVQAARQQEQAALAEADIKAAMAKVAGGRQAIPSIVPTESDDLSPMSGWIHAPDHTTYTPRTTGASLAGEAATEAGAAALPKATTPASDAAKAAE